MTEIEPPDFRRITQQEIVFAATVRRERGYHWLVWGPRAWQREGRATSRDAAWYQAEIATRLGAEMIRRRGRA